MIPFEQLTSTPEWQEATPEARQQAEDLYARDFWTELSSHPEYKAKAPEEQAEIADMFVSRFTNGASIIKPEGGLIASAKSAVGQTIKGAGQFGADFLGADDNNAVKQYGQEIIDANPTAVRELSDIAEQPGTAAAEAIGNAAPSMGGMLATRAVGQGITAMAPFTGPAAPLVAAGGQIISWLGPPAIAALPSFGGIRDKQIFNDQEAQDSAKSKAIAVLGAGAVGAIETSFGPQNWALAMLTKEGRAQVAKKFTATSLGGKILEGGVKGGLVEGSEELAQSPIEQIASGDDPTSQESINDTVLSGAMGAIGGGIIGGAMGPMMKPREKQPEDILQAESVDEAIDTFSKSIDQKIDAIPGRFTGGDYESRLSGISFPGIDDTAGAQRETAYEMPVLPINLRKQPGVVLEGQGTGSGESQGSDRTTGTVEEQPTGIINSAIRGQDETQQASTQSTEGAGVAAVQTPAGAVADILPTVRAEATGGETTAGIDIPAGRTADDLDQGSSKSGNVDTEQPIPISTPIIDIKAQHGTKVGTAVQQARANKESISLPEAYRRAGVEMPVGSNRAEAAQAKIEQTSGEFTQKTKEINNVNNNIPPAEKESKRFSIRHGLIFDNHTKTSVSFPATPESDRDAILDTLNFSIYNGAAKIVPVSLGANEKGDHVITSAAEDIEDIVIRRSPQNTTAPPAADASPVVPPQPGEPRSIKQIHDYSNTQVNVTGPAAKKITDFGKRIPETELYTGPQDDSYGREKEPHITVRYGLDTDDPTKLSELSKLGPITAKIGKVSIFETDKYDVVKAEIDSASMRAANKKVGELVSLPGETYKDYQPHATIAYVKKGEGKKYVGDKSLEGTEITFDEINLSDRTGETHPIKLQGKTEITKQPQPDTENTAKNDTKDVLVGSKSQYSGQSTPSAVPAESRQPAEKTEPSSTYTRPDGSKFLGLNKDNKDVWEDDKGRYVIDENGYLNRPPRPVGPGGAKASNYSTTALYYSGRNEYLTNEEYNQLANEVGETPQPEAKQSTEDQIKKLSDDDIDNLFDEVDSGRAPKKEPKPKAAKPPKTAATITKEGGIAANTAVKEAVAGLTKLFGDPNTLRSGPAFDEETYRQAKPHFVAAWTSVKDVGYSVKELIKYFYDQFGDTIRPYLQRFVKDVRDGDLSVAPKVEKLPASLPERTIAFSNFFYARYVSGEWNYKNITQARKTLADHYGITDQSDGYFRKAVDEAIEYAVVRISRDKVTSGINNQLSGRQIFEQLVEVYDNHPNLGVRTSESVRNQAYSTPAPIAFLANRLAGMSQRRGQTVFEPTAGTGMLLISADPDSVAANELDETRTAILKDQGFISVISGDAMAVQTAGKVDVVIANPPFGTVKDSDGRPKIFTAGDFRTTQIDQAIALHALDQMAEDGKAVLIIGGLDKQTPEDERAKKYNSLSKRRFFIQLYDTFNVTDHFTVAGELYSKQGAGWPIDIIVIDKKGRSDKALPNFIAPPIYRSFTELGERLEQTETGQASIFGVDATRQQQEAATPVRGPRTIATGNAFTPGGTGSSTASGQGSVSSEEGTGDRPGGTKRPGRTPGQPGTSAGTGQQSDGQSNGIAGNRREPGTNGLSPDRDQRTENADGDTGSEGTVRVDDTIRLDERPGAGSRRDVIASQGQTHYIPSSRSEQIGTLVPQNMATSLQNALQRLADKHGSIDKFVQEKLKYPSQKALFKAFSAEQIDAVALSLDNLEKGNGFIIGDQTGIGKGRVVAAMIRYAYLNGKTPVFITEKQALYADMYRDMVDIGFEKNVVNDIMQTNSDNVFLNQDDDVKLVSPSRWSATLGDTEGMPVIGKGKGAIHKKIVFSTYDQFSMQFEGGGDRPAPRRRFLSQLVNSSEVVLIMDEAHNAGGSGDLYNLRPSPKTGIVPHPRALFFRQIIPRTSGVIYSSATYAKNPDVMDLYSATDLTLGVGGDPQALAAAIAQGGIPFQQITAGMLTEAGQYIRRERSFDGVTYTPKVMDVDVGIAERVSASMSEIRQFEETFIVQALEEGGDVRGSAAVGETGQQAQNFTSLMHNIIDQMLLALKVKPSVELAIDILKKGESANEQVVLTMSNTMGSFINSYSEANGLTVGDKINAKFNDLLERYLYNTRLMTDGTRDENGDLVKYWMNDEELGPEGVREYKRVQKMIKGLDLEGLPVSPVDYMHNALRQAGYPALEITGRDFTIDYSSEPVLSRRDPKVRSVNGRNATIKSFNTGKNRVIILNRSGSTGISLHASERNPAKGQGKRTMIVVQPEKDINVHMQMLGRVHRTGQVVTPAYVQAVANVPAEKKPAALLVARMASLNANTTADADSILSDKTTVNFLNRYGDHVAAQAMSANPRLNTMLGSPWGGPKSQNDNLAKKVTGRLPLLPLAQQEEIYNALSEAYVEHIAELDATGRNDLEAKHLGLDARTIEQRNVVEATGPSIFQGAVVAERVDMKRIGKPYTSEEVAELLQEHKGEGEEESRKALEEFEIYRDTSMAAAQRKVDAADTDIKRTAAQLSRDELETRLRKDKNDFETLNDLIAVGTPIRLDLELGAEPISGIVIGKVQKGEPNNPLALSTWKTKVAVADGMRVVSLSFSRIFTYGVVVEEDSGKVMVHRRRAANGGPFLIEDERAIEEFDAANTVSRQERVIITGNLFTGYSMFRDDRGRIINFTRENGDVSAGVLMPVGFDPQARLDQTPVTFATADQLLAFANTADPAVIKLRQPGDLRIVHHNGNFRISTHKAVSKAGRFFRDDRALIAITGSFTSVGNNMATNVLSKQQITEVFDLFRSRGNTWFTDSNLDEARTAIGSQQEAPKLSTSLPPSQQADTPTELRAKLGRGYDALIRSGKVRLVETQREAERIIEYLKSGVDILYSEDGNTIEGFAHKGISYLVSDGIAKGKSWSTLVHETGWHVQNALQSSPTFKRILRNFESRLDEQSPEGKILREAMAQVPKDTPAEHRTEEALAYAIANNPETGIVRRFIALVKNLLVKMGINPRIFSVADLRALAEVAVRREARAALREEATDKESLSVGEGLPVMMSAKINQSISSAATSIPQVAALFKKAWVKLGKVNIDIGGGKFDNGTEYLAENGTENLVYDPFNRSDEHNDKVIRRLSSGPVDTATATNVLNVIKEQAIRREVVRQAAKAINQDGTAYFQIHQGDRDGNSRVTKQKDGVALSWQNHQPTAWYLNDVKTYFKNVVIKDGVLVATGPIKDSGMAVWENKDGSPLFSKTTNPDIMMSVGSGASTAPSDYELNRKTSRSFKRQAIRNSRNVIESIGAGLDKFLGAISTRARNISPKIEAKLRTLDFNTGTHHARDVKAILPLLEKAKKMTSEDFADWDYARKNSDTERIDELVEKYGMADEYQAYRETLNRVRDEANTVGLDVAFIQDYAPRVLKDPQGFLNHLGRGDQWPVITDAIRKKAKELEIPVSKMSPEMKADIVSRMLYGSPQGLGGPGNAKERTIKRLPPELNQYYMDSDGALMQYLYNMRKHIEIRNFFGKLPEVIAGAKASMHAAEARLRAAQDEGAGEKRIEAIRETVAEYRAILDKYNSERDYSDNIAQYFIELSNEGIINPKQEQEFVDIMQARFHEQGTRGVIQAYKNLSYIDTMGNPLSAITQIGDFAWTIYANGWIPTIKAAGKSLAKSSRITKEDVGIERIAQEFADTDTLSKAVAKVFKWVGLEKMDTIGKEAFLNAALEKYEVRAVKEPDALRQELVGIYEDETDGLIDDLQNKRITENVKLLVYSRLLDFQPAALSEQSEQYLKAGNGRIFYMLKSYTLKQFDVYRREVYTKLKNGDKAEKIDALKSLVYLSALIVLANGAGDEIKDFLLGRKTSFEDRVVDNILRLFGVSKYVTWQARTEGAGTALTKQILPPFKFVNALYKDVQSAGDDKGLEVVSSVPIVGKLAYWHMGRGSHNRKDYAEIRFTDKKKRLTDIKEKVDTDPKLRMKYRREMAEYRRLHEVANKTTQQKKEINKVKLLEKQTGRDYSARIERMEKARLAEMERYLSTRGNK